MNRRSFFKAVTGFVAGIYLSKKKLFTRSQWVGFSDGEWHFLVSDCYGCYSRFYIDGKEIT